VRDGAAWPAVRVRRILPGDAPDLEAFYAALDPETRLLRFHAATAGLSHSQSEWFCRPDIEHHEGFLAVVPVEGGPEGHGAERIVAHLCVEPTSPTDAEIALVVEPSMQGRGIGRRMAEDAIAWARQAGIRTLTATMMVGNEPIRRLLTTLGLPATFTPTDAGTCGLSIDLTAEPPRPAAA
jgi:GNAT superfamily N-acetyltransferase